MELLLTNTNTNTAIRNDQIIRNTDTGIVVNNSNCWKFIPAENVKQDKIYSEHYTVELPTAKKVYNNYNPYLAQSDISGQNYQEKLECRFGFQQLSVSTRKSAAASAMLSEKIDTSRTERITIDCEIIHPDIGAVEIYIIDHNDEIPILPNQEQHVERERLFFGEDTRFPINQKQEIVLYEDNKQITRDYLGLTARDFQKHIYTLSYTADGNYAEYKPIGDKIAIKIILRQYAESPLFIIDNLIVHKYGETPVWNLQQ